MARRGGGFGLVLLVVTTAVVLLLAARAWREAGGTAVEVTQPATAGAVRADPELQEALEGLPGLDDARREAEARAREVQDALSEIE